MTQQHVQERRKEGRQEKTKKRKNDTLGMIKKKKSGFTIPAGRTVATRNQNRRERLLVLYVLLFRLSDGTRDSQERDASVEFSASCFRTLRGQVKKKKRKRVQTKRTQGETQGRMNVERSTPSKCRPTPSQITKKLKGEATYKLQPLQLATGNHRTIGWRQNQKSSFRCCYALL